MDQSVLEACCVAILAAYLWVRGRNEPDRAGLLRRLSGLMLASWLGENTVIHAYHFYGYAPRWSLFVDQVPILIITIWPVVIHSAWELAGLLLRGRGGTRRVALGAALVFCDAWMIEPIAVHCGLWHWNVPGLFAVPPIGVLGWSIFAGLCMVGFDRGWSCLRVLVVAPLAAHVLLAVSWWGALRWVSVDIPAWPAVVVVGLLSAAATIFILRHRLAERVALPQLLVRIPPALLFFALLALSDRIGPALVGWAVAFSPPWLALTLGPRNPKRQVVEG